MTNPLTGKQKEIYDTIVALKKKYPMTSPTLTELSRLFNMTLPGMAAHLGAIEKKGYIKKEVKENKDYKKPRHCHSLAKKIPRLNFTKGEEIFLDNFLLKLLPLTQSKLKEMAYNTEPMIKHKRKGKRR